MKEFIEGLIFALSAVHFAYYLYAMAAILAILFMVFYTFKAVTDLNPNSDREIPINLVLAATYLFWLIIGSVFTAFYWLM